MIGISIYPNEKKELTLSAIDHAEKAGLKIGFSTLQLPEDNGSDLEEFQEILLYARQHGIKLIVDISPTVLEKYHLSSYEDLHQYGIEYVRLDSGFTVSEIAAKFSSFHIVLNASTVTEKDVNQLKAAGIDLNWIYACHNYYPEPYTGISMELVKSLNHELHHMGIETIAFIPGDNHLRGPLHNGLATVEEHRLMHDEILRNALELLDTETDHVLIGDIDVKEKDWKILQNLNNGFIEVPLVTDKIIDDAIIHHDRIDRSEWLWRSTESRLRKISVQADEPRLRCRGAVCINNSRFLRYEGEISIARKDLPADDRVNVIGYIPSSCVYLLNFASHKLGIRFKRVTR